MAQRRRYTRPEKVAAIAAAVATSGLAAAEAHGIPESTLRGWLHDPQYDIYRQNAAEGMAEEARIVARMAWEALAMALRSGTLDGRDLVLLAGMATDKATLLNGGATSRTETRDITGTLSDAELVAALREAERLTAAVGDPAAPADPPEG